MRLACVSITCRARGHQPGAELWILLRRCDDGGQSVGLTCCISFIWIVCQIARPHTWWYLTSNIVSMLQDSVRELLSSYLDRFSVLAGPLVTCGPVLSWLEVDNRGNRWEKETHSGAMSIIECFGSEGYQTDQIKTFSLWEYIFHIHVSYQIYTFLAGAIYSDYKCKFKIRWFGWNDIFLQALFHISIKRCFDSK